MTEPAPDSYAVIMAGGSGTRFWPASRRSKPKQFLPIAGDRPLIAETMARLEGVVAPERTLVVTGAEHVDEALAALPDLPRDNLLVEPSPHNTLPCAALAAFEIRRRSPRSLQVLLPADHVVRPTARFQESLRAGFDAARDAAGLVTFGIQPDFAATGYGYIQMGAEQPSVGGQTVYRVEAFHEKPSEEKAQAYIDSGHYVWNSGIFVWSSESFLTALARHAPDVHDGLADVSPHDCEAAYASLPSVSIDVGLAERVEGSLVLPIDYTWSDVGSWSALFDVLAAGEDGHRTAGGTAVTSTDSQDCVVYGPPGHVTALVGVRDLVVVRAGNATLVCPRERAQEVRDAVERAGRIDPSFL